MALLGNSDPAAAAPSYATWLSAQPARRAEVAKFDGFLRSRHVAGVVPMQELLLNASSWRGCGIGAPWSVAERPLWSNVVTTLRFIRDEVKPVLGDVDVVSGYRNEELNRCSHGAPRSAHRNFYALDVIPRRKISRDLLIAKMCALHRSRGAPYQIGLGFYDGLRFHLDSEGYRLWGPDFHAITSPCLKRPA